MNWIFHLESDIGTQLLNVNRNLQELTTKSLHLTQRRDIGHEEIRQLRHERDGCLPSFNFAITFLIRRFHRLECASKIRNIEDVDKKRLEMLRRERPQAYDAVMWLRNNKERFKANIYEPLAISVSNSC